MRTTSLLSSFAALVAGVAVFGCSPSVTRTADENPGGAMPVVNPKERLEKERMAAATAGLDFTGATVKVSAPVSTDKAKAARLMAKADSEIASRNVWFLAVGAYRDAILADPGDAKAYVGLGRAFLVESENDRAEKALRTAIALDPKSTEARYIVGTLRQGAGDYSGAVAEWKALAGIEPGYRDVYARLAIASYYDLDYKAAWTFLSQAESRKQAVPPQFKSLLKEVAPRP